MTIALRKNNHIEICMTKNVRSAVTNGFECYRLLHKALPEADFESYSIESKFLNYQISAPFLISSMTGGTESGEKINRNLIEAAEALNIPFAIGSQRIYLLNSEKKPLDYRRIAPDIPILANLGAIQLNYGFSRDHFLKAVDMIGADALILHLNPLQELIQKDGDTNFSDLLRKIGKLCSNFPVPVIVKEVGWGIQPELAKKLTDAGVFMIDAAGAGGTSWSQVESLIDESGISAKIAAPFADWGIPTAECIRSIHQKYPEIKLIASGGITNGVEAAKAIFLGAQLCGMALHLLNAAAEGSAEKVAEEITCVIKQYKIAHFLSNGIVRIDGRSNETANC